MDWPFSGPGPRLGALLDEGLVLTHPSVLGELAFGNLPRRSRVLQDLHALPKATTASDGEVLETIEALRLWGRGIGWVDTHLMVSALLSKCDFWTLDDRLRSAASHAGVNVA